MAVMLYTGYYGNLTYKEYVRSAMTWRLWDGTAEFFTEASGQLSVEDRRWRHQWLQTRL